MQPLFTLPNQGPTNARCHGLNAWEIYRTRPFTLEKFRFRGQNWVAQDDSTPLTSPQVRDMHAARGWQMEVYIQRMRVPGLTVAQLEALKIA